MQTSNINDFHSPDHDDVFDDFMEWTLDTRDDLLDDDLDECVINEQGQHCWNKLSSIPEDEPFPCLVHESEEFNIEYKLKLNPSEHRFTRLVTQMNFRLLKGNNTAHYMIGVSDDGSLTGTPRHILDQSLLVLTRMANSLEATALVVCEMYFDPVDQRWKHNHDIQQPPHNIITQQHTNATPIATSQESHKSPTTHYTHKKHYKTPPPPMVPEDCDPHSRWVAEVKVFRKEFIIPPSNTHSSCDDMTFTPDSPHQLRVATCGDANSGKSTLLSYLTTGAYDDGHSTSRQGLLHQHFPNIISAIPSTDSNDMNSPITYIVHMTGLETQEAKLACDDAQFTDEITQHHTKSFNSNQILMLCDLAGHEKIVKSITFDDLASIYPHCCMLVISAENPLDAATIQQQCVISTGLGLPFFVVVTKADSSTSHHITQTVVDIINEIGCPVKMITSSQHSEEAANAAVNSLQVNVMCVSNVTGQGLPCLLAFINALHSHVSRIHQMKSPLEPIRFVMDARASDENEDAVIGGTLLNGTLSQGEELVIGPTQQGRYFACKVMAIVASKSHTHSVSADRRCWLRIHMEHQHEIGPPQVLLPSGTHITAPQYAHAIKEFDVVVFSVTTPTKSQFPCFVRSGAMSQQAIAQVTHALANDTHTCENNGKNDLACRWHTHITLTSSACVRVDDCVIVLSADGWSASGRVNVVCFV